MPGYTPRRSFRKDRFSLPFLPQTYQGRSTKRRHLSPGRTFPRLKVLSSVIEALTHGLDGLAIGLRDLFRFDNTFVHKLCLIIGLASIAGFLVDFTVAALPPQPLEATWQLEIVRLAADRSLVWLIGLGLLAFTLRDNPALKRPFSLFCLLLGVIYLLLCIPAFQSTVFLRENANQNISQQASQTLEQLQAVQAEPPEGGQAITPEQIQDATQQVNLQAETLRRNARQRLYKSLAITLGNLVVAGIAAIALSRLMAGEIDFEGFVANRPSKAKSLANPGDF